MTGGLRNTRMWLVACAMAMFATVSRTGAGEQKLFPCGTSSEYDTQLPAGVKLYWERSPRSRSAHIGGKSVSTASGSLFRCSTGGKPGRRPGSPRPSWS